MNASSDLQFVEPRPPTPARPPKTSRSGSPAGPRARPRAAPRASTCAPARHPLARVEDRLEPLSADLSGQLAIRRAGERVQQRPLEWLGAGAAWRVELARAVGRPGELLVVHRRPGRGPHDAAAAAGADARSLLKVVPRRVRAACDGDGLIVVSAPTTVRRGGRVGRGRRPGGPPARRLRDLAARRRQRAPRHLGRLRQPA